MRAAVVTGARRGIGLAIAGALERDGYDVLYSARSPDGPEGKIYMPCDISKPDDRKALLDRAVELFGGVNLLVNNAGTAPETRMDILETTEHSFDRVLDVNLKGTFFMCQLFAGQMLKQGGADCRIVNISSISSYAASVGRGEYCVSKAGVSMVTELFAVRLAAEGVGVFEVRPGIIQTDMTKEVMDKYNALIKNGLTPVPRAGKPGDVAECVSAIASGKLDFACGQVINADGGFHLRWL